MKKVLTILAIMIVAVCAVFAAETHKITVGTTVAEVLPSFSMRYENSATVRTNNSAYENSIENKVFNNQFDASKSYNDANYGMTGEVANTFVDTGLDISTQNVVANFYAVLAIGGRQDNKGYTLKFTAGSFNTKVNGVQSPETATACSSSTIGIEGTALSGTTNQAIVVSAGQDEDVTANNAKAWKITMKGAPVTSVLDLVKFTATWNRNSAVDVGTYTADVTLEITANS